MSDVDKFLLKLDAEEKIREFADTICDTPEKRSAFVRTCGEYLEWNGNRLLFLAGGGTKIPVHHDPNDTAMKFFKEKFNFLLTPEKKLNDQIAPLVPIDPETVALALTGNWTAKGKIARALGDNKEAAELFLKAEAAKGGDRDTAGRFTSNKGDSDNPWSLAGWNVTKQGAVYKSDPALAARLAKAAGSHIGATRATKAA